MKWSAVHTTALRNRSGARLGCQAYVAQLLCTPDYVQGNVRVPPVIALAEKDRRTSRDVGEVQTAVIHQSDGTQVGRKVSDHAVRVQVDMPVTTGDGFNVSAYEALQGSQVRLEVFDPHRFADPCGNYQGSTCFSHFESPCITTV